MARADHTARAEQPADQLLLTHEVAHLFGVGSATVGRWVRERRLPAVRTLGGHHRFRRSDIDTLIASMTVPQEQPD